MSDEELGYVVLNDEDYTKAVGQFRLAVGAVLAIFNMYGMDVYIKGAQDEIVQLAEDYGQRIRGIDKPISIEYIRRKK
jgi:reverse gyrase